MMNSMADQLQQEMVCERLLECVHGLRPLDTACYETLVESQEPLTVDAVAASIDRDRTTAYRSTQRLFERGLINRDQINYDHGGYVHVYYPADPSAVAANMQRRLNDWYATIDRLIQEFKDTYDTTDDSTAVEE